MSDKRISDLPTVPTLSPGTDMIPMDQGGITYKVAISRVAGAVASVAWGTLSGTLSDQTDLQTALNTKAGGSGTANGTNTGDQTITLTSDVTGSGTGSFATTITDKAVTLSKMADMATSSVIYRKTAGSGVPEVNTLATLKTDLSLAKGDVGLGNVDNTSNATERAATATLTNKRMQPRVGSTTSSATPTINTDNYDIYQLTAQTVDITSFTTNLTGTPTEGEVLLIEITGTAARAITWGTKFEASTVALPTTTVTTAKLSVGFLWNSVTSKWRCMASC